MRHRAVLPQELKVSLASHPFLGRRRAYKFATTPNAEAMCKRGSFKIGRLEEFRELESKQLQDRSEGLNAVRGGSEIEYHDLPSNSIVRKVIRCDPSVTKLTIKLSEGGEISSPFDFPAFCFSYLHDDTVRRSLCDASNGYDAVVEIADIFALAELMASDLSQATQRDTRYVCAPVAYRDAERKLTDPSPENLTAAFEKSQHFAANCEGRIVFFFPEQRNYCQIWADADETIPFNGLVTLPGAASLLN